MDDETAEVRESLWRLPAMQALVAVTVLGFASYCLTLASLPYYVAAGGTSVDSAGVVTAAFLLVAVLTQASVPALTTRCGLGPVLTAGIVAIGAPAPLYLLGDSLVWVSAVSAVRGAGFGVLTVLGATLAARAVPLSRRGEAIGVYGLAIAVPNLVAVPAGVALILDGQVAWVAWLAASPLLALPMVGWLSGATAPADPRAAGAGGTRTAMLAAAAPSLVLFVVTLAGGGLMTFLPIERPDGPLATVALLLFGLTGALFRWQAGVLADRIGSRLLLPASMVVGAAGLVLVAAGLAGAGPACMLAGAFLFGGGYGAVQNLSLVLAFARAGTRGMTTASAVWNASFDAGTAVGAVAVGAVAAHLGLPWSYVILAGSLVLALPMALASTARR